MTDSNTPLSSSLWNVPNILTFMRIVLSVVMFVLIPFGMYCASLVLFIIAASTDWLDGWWARRFHLVSQFGRITDSMADKVLICGSFIYLVALSDLQHIEFACLPGWNFGLAPWMVVVIVVRELLVTILRGFVESSGGDFSAKKVGKWKMGLQCVVVPACFIFLILKQRGLTVPSWITLTLVVSLWVTIILTLWSAIGYMIAAARFGSQK